MKKLRALLVGYGYWGPNLARNISTSMFWELGGVVELNDQRRELVRKVYNRTEVFTSIEDCNPGSFDAVFIATPAKTHSSIADFFINQGVHVWVEKPATVSLLETENLIAHALRKSVKIVVDHPYLYSPAVNWMKDMTKDIGRLLYFDSSRANLGIFSPDVSVLWDLAVHDLSILNYLVPDQKPESVNCFSRNPIQAGQDNMVDLSINYSSGFSAHISCNWLSPIKIRRTILGGLGSTIIFDDTESIEKIKMYTQEFHSEQKDEITRDMLISFTSGDIRSPRLSTVEPLQLAISDFARSIIEDEEIRISLRSQLPVIEILETATRNTNKNEMVNNA